VSKIDKTTDAIIETIPLDSGSSPWGIATDDTFVWVADQAASRVTKITKSTSATTSIPTAFRSLAVFVDGESAWVTSSDENQVTRLSKTTDALEAEIQGVGNFHYLGDGTGARYDRIFASKQLYEFAGFYQPVDNLPALNSVKAGSAVPIKFGLGGNYGLSVFDPGFPKSQTIACSSTAPVDVVEETVTAGGSSLSYDAASGRYNYVWKSDKAWAGTCRQLILNFNDGSIQRANFKFTK
jgi:hypothetical protein